MSLVAPFALSFSLSGEIPGCLLLCVHHLLIHWVLLQLVIITHFHHGPSVFRTVVQPNSLLACHYFLLTFLELLLCHLYDLFHLDLLLRLVQEFIDMLVETLSKYHNKCLSISPWKARMKHVFTLTRCSHNDT